LLAEGASAAQSKFKKFFYVSVLKNITKECDCKANPSGIIAKDIGYMFGKDGVAIDKASYDLVLKSEGKDVFLHKNKKTGLQHVEAAEKLGMGKTEYEIVKL